MEKQTHILVDKPVSMQSLFSNVSTFENFTNLQNFTNFTTWQKFLKKWYSSVYFASVHLLLLPWGHVSVIPVDEEPVAPPAPSKWELVDYGNDTSDEEEEDRKPRDQPSVPTSQPQ